MTRLICEQITEIAVMACSGILFMTLMQAGVYLRRRLLLGRLAATVLELMLWVIQALIMSAFLYYCACGRWNFEAFLGLAIGVLLWSKFIYGIIMTR